MLSALGLGGGRKKKLCLVWGEGRKKGIRGLSIIFTSCNLLLYKMI